MILIVGAMTTELSALIASLKNQVPVTMNPTIYCGKISGKEIMILDAGIGKVQAAFSLTKTLLTYPQITLIINIGLAGAIGDVKIGELIKIKDVYYHDFDLTIFGYKLGQVPGQPPFYQSDRIIDSIVSLSGLKQFRLYTGDAFLTKKSVAFSNYCVDMEGAALFHIANNFKVPIISLKVVSDILGKSDFDEYKQFEINDGAVIINEAIKKILKELK